MIWACQCGYHPTILESKTVFCERFGELRKTNPRIGNSCRPRLVHLWYISTPWSLTVHTGMKRFTVTSSLRSHTHRASCSTSLQMHSTGIHDYYHWPLSAIVYFLRNLCILCFIYFSFIIYNIHIMINIYIYDINRCIMVYCVYVYIYIIQRLCSVLDSALLPLNYLNWKRRTAINCCR